MVRAFPPMKKYSLDKSQIKVLLLEGIHESAVEVFRLAGYRNIETHDKALDDVTLAERIRDAHLVGIRSRTRLSQDLLERAEKLIAVGCFSIGTNQVNTRVAKSLGVPVFNAPFSNTRSVAELVIAEAILLLRGIPEKNAAAHRGQWLKSARNAYEARGKTLGIVGYGRIGSQVSILAESVGMKVLYYDIENKLTLGNARPCTSLEEILAEADLVTLHVPSTVLTRNMIGAKELRMMKAGACLINASRGDVVDVGALADALRSRHLSGAAVDVFPEEPASNDAPFTSELQAFDNAILTPHIGGSTHEAQASIGVEVADKLVKYSDNGSTLSAVNFVGIALPPNDRQRFLHIHHNVPGVLREINGTFSWRGINIAAQYLQTDAEIGYVITDVESEAEVNVLKDLKGIPHTIKARMLY